MRADRLEYPMGYLRQVRSPLPQLPTESSCLEVYERELDYLFATLQRMGANPREIEDLAQEVFVVLHRNWPTLDTTRPFRLTFSPWHSESSARIGAGGRAMCLMPSWIPRTRPSAPKCRSSPSSRVNS